MRASNVDMVANATVAWFAKSIAKAFLPKSAIIPNVCHNVFEISGPKRGAMAPSSC